MNTQTTPKNSRSFILPVILVILGVAAVGYFASKAGLDKALVQQQVDSWILAREAQAKQQGYYLDISYENLKFEGPLSERYLVLENPQVVVASAAPDALDAPASEVFRVSTKRALLHPLAMDLSQFRIELPDALQGFTDKNSPEPAITVSANTPLMIQAEKHEEKSGDSMQFQHYLPNEWTLVFAGEPKETYVLSLAEGGVFTSTVGLANHATGQATIALNEVAIRTADAKEKTALFNASKLEGTWKNEEEKAGIVNYSSVFSLSEASGEAFSALSPFNLRWNVSVETNNTTDKKGDVAESALKLREFTLEGKDAAINANADFVSSQQDILPVGMASINIKNLTQIRKILAEQKILTARDEVLMDTLISRITGKALNQSDDVTIDITRVREGAFQIGKITFEEALTLFLSQKYSPKK